MTCQDFQRKWNELLDAETDASPASAAASSVDAAEALLSAHAADCAACRPISARYQTLRHAIRAWRQPPTAPADLLQRILSAPAEPVSTKGRWDAHHAGESRSTRSPSFRLVTGLAAAVLFAVGLNLALRPIAPGPGADRPVPARGQIASDLHSISDREKAPPALNRALAEATSATWDLARSASEPAARIGRDVLDATVRPGDGASDRSVRSAAMAQPEPDEGLASLSVSMPSLDSLGPGGAGASDVLQQVGDKVSAGVRPLSSTARHAFGFLLGPPRASAGERPGGSTSSGARSG